MRNTLALPEGAKRPVHGALAGFFLDMFDIYLPTIVLAPAIIYFLAPDMPDATAAILTSLIFISTLLGRPLGALIFGQQADRIGRKKINLIAATGFGIATLLMAALPGYYQLGTVGVALFVLLRFICGVFIGGSYTAANTLAMESLPRHQRGFWGAYIVLGTPFAFVTISLMTLLMLRIAPVGGIESPYVQWGWRIPFIIGGLMSVSYAYWYRRNVNESVVFKATGGSDNALKTLLSGKNFKSFGQAVLLLSGFWLSFNALAGPLPKLLLNPVGLNATTSTVALCIAYLVLAGGYLAAGLISQKTGRRPFLMAAGIISAVVGTFLYYLLLNSPPRNLVVVILLVAALILVVVWFWGLATTYLNELFQTGIRASGFGLGYSVAIIPGSLYAFYQLGLDSFMPSDLTILPLVAIGGLLVTIGAAIGPETRDVEFLSASGANGDHAHTVGNAYGEAAHVGDGS